ncbi:MAG: hypothetical protein J0H98_09330 [Solirubrobacterales bacterium]|nr:hypothetical protein [Solirubrobacterales bacterium]
MPASADLIDDEIVWAGDPDGKEKVSWLDWSSTGGGSYQATDECDSGWFYTCDFFPDGGPIIKIPKSGTYPAGSKAEWTYTAPGGPDTYIAEFGGVGLNVPGESELTMEVGEPHAYFGMWDGSSWSAYTERDDLGALDLHDEVGGPGDRQIKFGVKASSAASFSDDHWAALAQLHLSLGDDVPPVLDFDSGDLPPAGWIDETPIQVPFSAEDNGIGLWAAGIMATARSVGNPWVASGLWADGFGGDCTGATADPCPLSTPPGQMAEIRPAEIKEGWNSGAVFALDKTGNLADEYEVWDLGIDTIDPKVILGGSFMSAPGMVLDGPSYSLEADATDGETGKDNSGVVAIEVLIDNVAIDSDSQSCPTENCELGVDPTIVSDNYSNGPHQLKVKATDAVGHVKTTTVDFTVDR